MLDVVGKVSGFLRGPEDGDNLEEEAKEAYHGCHLDAQVAEDVGVKRILSCCIACHQDETEDNDSKSDDKQDVVCFCECKVLHLCSCCLVII